MAVSALPARIHDAVTAVLVCGDEIFLVRRQPYLQAFPGYWAFPGGKVDKTDAECRLDPAIRRDLPSRLIAALERELQEELGWDLAAAGAAGEIVMLEHLGEATTPAFIPIRFCTHFYRIELRRKPDFALDPGEAAECEWGTAAAWLEKCFFHAERLCAPPTLIVLQALAENPLARLREGMLPDFESRGEVPMVETSAGFTLLPVRSNTLFPATHTNAFVFGNAVSLHGAPAKRILVDPSPNNLDELGRLLRTLARCGTVHEVFLTHHHPDHREHAEKVAQELDVPMGMSATTRDYIERETGGAFFRNVRGVRIYGDGDIVCHVGYDPVRALAVPGHDEGQLALMPDSRKWCIVGDLIQGIGTVVIAPPEGDMAKYFASLQRIIDLDPNVIIPSHGPALGTTHYIREALKHRKAREQQVLEGTLAGKSIEELLPIIYQGTPPVLLPLARINIQSHLAKLKAEGRVG